MSKITIYVNDDTIQKLKKISNESGDSLSKISSKLIEQCINLNINQQKNEVDISQNKKMTPLEKKQYVHIVTILNIVMEINKKLNNEPLKYGDQSTDTTADYVKNHILEKIKDL